MQFYVPPLVSLVPEVLVAELEERNSREREVEMTRRMEVERGKSRNAVVGAWGRTRRIRLMMILTGGRG